MSRIVPSLICLYLGTALSSSCCSLISAAEGIVANKRTANLHGDAGGSGSWIASCRVSRGLGLIGLGVLRALISKEAVDLDIRHVLVLAVAAEPDESLRDELRLESCDGFLVTNQDDVLRLGSNNLNGIPQ